MKIRALIRTVLCFLLFIPLIMADFNIFFTLESKGVLIACHIGVAVIAVLSLLRYLKICRTEEKK